MGWQEQVIWSLQDTRQPWLDALMWIPNLLGSSAFYFLAMPLVALFLERRRGFQFFWVMIFNLALMLTLKDGLGHLRPFQVLGFTPLHGDQVQTSFAFPSGHAMGTAAFWFSLAVLWKRTAGYLLAALITLGVSLSRVYAGVHWPQDVIAGALLGSSLCILAWRVFAWWPSRPWVWILLGAAALLAMAPTSERVLPLLGLLLGWGGIHFAPNRPPAPEHGASDEGARADKRRQGLQYVLIGLLGVGVCLVAGWQLLGSAPVAQMLTLFVAGVWLSLLWPWIQHRWTTAVNTAHKNVPPGESDPALARRP